MTRGGQRNSDCSARAPALAATASAIAKSVKALKAKGKALVGFECARGPDRDKANAALKAGAFAVGNW